MFLKERNHPIIERLRSHQGILATVGLGKSHIGAKKNCVLLSILQEAKTKLENKKCNGIFINIGADLRNRYGGGLIMDVKITLTVNGKKSSVMTDPKRPLLDVLREDLHLTGTKYGCGEARCGACTVLMDGRGVLSCVTPVADADKKTIVTIEGLAKGDCLHPVQEAFLAEGAIQCGYCTPGMILTVVVLLERNPQPTDHEIAEEMNGNLCRCCNYLKILAAIRRAAGQGSEVSKS